MRILRPYKNIIGFYDGRIERTRRYHAENWFDDGALELGICSYAVVEGDEAIVYDTHVSTEHARVIRETLELEGVRRITVVLSHWHADHVAGNAVFADCEIVANAHTRTLLETNRADLEEGLPPISPLVLPNTIFSGMHTLKVGRQSVELWHFDIHSSDGTVLFLPDQKVLLAGDTLEDPITYVVEPERLEQHLADLERLANWPLDAILPNHGCPDRIASGGYDRRLIAATRRYVNDLIASDQIEPAGERSLAGMFADHFASGALVYYPAYEQIHLRNKHVVRSSRV